MTSSEPKKSARVRAACVVAAAAILLSACGSTTPFAPKNERPAAETALCDELWRARPTYSEADTTETLAQGADFLDLLAEFCA